jgi:uncharacterized membrane protein
MSDPSPSQHDDAWVGHLYRATAGDNSMWRQRLDVTSNWAVPLVLALVTLTLSERTVSHLVLLVLGWALIVLATFVEARRYRTLHAGAWRAGLIERGYYVPRLEGTPEPDGWRAELAADLRRPTLKLSMWDAMRARVRATYAVLGHLLTLAWIAKLVSHPRLAVTGEEVLARLAVGDLVPGWIVLAAALLALVGATLVALSASPAEGLESKAAGRGAAPPRHELRRQET